MKQVLLPVAILVTLTGCSYVTAPSNHPPEAFINSISPAEATAGETVAFEGEGADSDGDIVGYQWHSSLDGDLSQLPSFETNTLSIGEHTISFSVQDNNGAWSAEVYDAVTVVPPPVTVVQFEASPAIIELGDSATLSWNVSNATSVSINQGIGTAPTVGSVTVDPRVTTTYTLEATGASSTATAIATITVKQGRMSITLTADSEESGYVRRSGDYRTVGIYVGDDNANRGIQGFLTFDISDIPGDAVIERVIIDLSSYDIPYQPPLPDLGCLGAYIHEYSSLYGQYQEGDLPPPVEEWCDFADIDTPGDSPGLADALQDNVGQGKFQLRLQFPGMATDGDETRDLLHWSREHLPTITVEYYSGRA
ncbi:MAG TPA: hypothetical protein ENL12_01825 [Dehalococcoidia bacterium]|nr:hypothetical protein [Dehalococcoidia bacterium]